MSDARLEELAANLTQVHARIAAAAAAAGRPPDDVRLVAVTKTWPGADVLRLHALGARDVGESYEQELTAKADMLAAADADVRWHFLGRLQRNKCAAVAARATLVHSVDRPEVVDALAAGARRAGRTVRVLLQVSFDGDPGRGGVGPDDVAALADRAAAAPELRLSGLMTVPPLGAEPRAVFSRLRELGETLRRGHPDASELSAGMSGDLEDAVAEGATLVRVGTALLGERPRAVR
jgi:pyridoxal phosphate enzyme (YggS family)